MIVASSVPYLPHPLSTGDVLPLKVWVADVCVARSLTTSLVFCSVACVIASGLMIGGVVFGCAWADAIRPARMADTRARCMVRSRELLNMSLCCGAGMVNSPNGLSLTQLRLFCFVCFGSCLGTMRLVRRSAKNLLMYGAKRSYKRRRGLVAIWITLLPAPGIPTHVVNVARRTPIK